MAAALARIRRHNHYAACNIMLHEQQTTFSSCKIVSVNQNETAPLGNRSELNYTTVNTPSLYPSHLSENSKTGNILPQVEGTL
jgi:hypothetical protein